MTVLGAFPGALDLWRHRPDGLVHPHQDLRLHRPGGHGGHADRLPRSPAATRSSGRRTPCTARPGARRRPGPLRHRPRPPTTIRRVAAFMLPGVPWNGPSGPSRFPPLGALMLLPPGLRPRQRRGLGHVHRDRTRPPAHSPSAVPLVGPGSFRRRAGATPRLVPRPSAQLRAATLSTPGPPAAGWCPPINDPERFHPSC